MAERFIVKILILEDSSSRVDHFMEKFSDHDLTITENALDAVVYLEEEVFDCIFLDHDLGTENGCGADVAAFLASGATPNIDATIIIHSWNTVAANSMRSILPNALFIPFGSEAFYGLVIDSQGS